MRYLRLPFNSPKLHERAEPLVRAIKFDDPSSVARAIENLAHDEHIDCARRAGIVDEVFIFLGAGHVGVRLPGTTVFYDVCLPSCRKRPHDDDCQRLFADQVLEPEILRPRIDAVFAHVGLPLEKASYILDIDLDVFRTRRAAIPVDPSLFRRLIRSAKAITIAREPGHVEELCLTEEEITADDLEALVLNHIQLA